uniref:Uncharacterized protein n=1 Tax=Arundo donax TaxID=35708 RepID=A0A0A8Z6H7_ARUDO
MSDCQLSIYLLQVIVNYAYLLLTRFALSDLTYSSDTKCP